MALRPLFKVLTLLNIDISIFVCQTQKLHKLQLRLLRRVNAVADITINPLFDSLLRSKSLISQQKKSGNERKEAKH